MGTPWLPEEGRFDWSVEGALLAGFVKNARFRCFLGMWRPPQYAGLWLLSKSQSSRVALIDDGRLMPHVLLRCMTSDHLDHLRRMVTQFGRRLCVLSNGLNGAMVFLLQAWHSPGRPEPVNSVTMWNGGVPCEHSSV